MHTAALPLRFVALPSAAEAVTRREKSNIKIEAVFIV